MRIWGNAVAQMWPWGGSPMPLSAFVSPEAGRGGPAFYPERCKHILTKPMCTRPQQLVYHVIRQVETSQVSPSAGRCTHHGLSTPQSTA